MYVLSACLMFYISVTLASRLSTDDHYKCFKNKASVWHTSTFPCDVSLSFWTCFCFSYLSGSSPIQTNATTSCGKPLSDESRMIKQCSQFINHRGNIEHNCLSPTFKDNFQHKSKSIDVYYKVNDIEMNTITLLYFVPKY